MPRLSVILSGALIAAWTLAPPVRSQTNRPTAPPIPAEVREGDRASLNQAALALDQGRFEQAEIQLRGLTPAAPARVFVDMVPVPKDLRAGYRAAIESAVQAWNAARSEPRFELCGRDEEAEILVLFERRAAPPGFGQSRAACDEVMVETAGGHRAARIYLELEIPNSPAPRSAASIAHIFGQGLGAYLGLGPAAQGLMGSDTHLADVRVTRPAGEVDALRRLEQSRAQLLDYARRKVAIHLPRAVIAIDKLEIDAGEVMRGDSPRYVFKVKNTGDAPLNIEAKPHCGCTVARFDRMIPPGGAGQIEAEVRTDAFRGAVIKTIEVNSNDVSQPQLTLRLGVRVQTAIEVAPAETAFIPLKADGPTLKEFQLQVREKEAVEISRVVCDASYATATLTPAENAPAGGRAYKLTLTLGPGAPVGRSTVIVMAQTTSRREPQVQITAICEKGIVALPATIYMGVVSPEPAAPVSQLVTLIRRDGPFHIKTLESDNPDLTVKQDAGPGEAQYRLTVTYKGGWAPGIFNGKITVATDDTRQPSITIPVMASVAAPGGGGVAAGSGAAGPAVGGGVAR